MSTIRCGMGGCRYNSGGFCKKDNVFLNQNMTCIEHFTRDGGFLLNWQGPDIQQQQEMYGTVEEETEEIKEDEQCGNG